MNRDQAREQLKGCLRSYVEQITEKSRGANKYVCPLCGSGKGKHGTGALSLKDNTQWKCFSCDKGGDIFDLIGAIEGLPDYNAQFKRACELFNADIDDYQSTPVQEASEPKTSIQKAYTHISIHTNTYTQSKQSSGIDYNNFFLQAHAHINETDYPQKRGLSEATVKRFGLGYVEQWRHPKAPNAPATPRLIIPTSNESYLARDTRADVPAEQMPYIKSKVGSIHLFNIKAIKEAKRPVFIVEGELDALSIIEVGGEAVALGTTSKTKALVELLKVEKPEQPLILAMDNDDAGEKAEAELAAALQTLNIPFYRANPAGQHKDANEALQRNREAFSAAVADAENMEQEADQAKREAYLQTSSVYKLQAFVNGIANNVNTPYIPTGFSKLDNVLDGGLYEGLYIIGAISSLGKTTLIMQIADQIAQQGTEVLIFSLEMASNEIIAKSISRHTVQTVLSEGGDIRNAKTARGITTGKRYKDYSLTEIALISSSIDAYRKYADHIYISEGMGNICAEQIRQTVKEHILYTGNTPVIIIDYIQILAPFGERGTEKQNMDKTVMELKRISRDYKTPVIGISSFNRSNYSAAVSMEAFKESGAIEYSSDVLIGLQLKGTGKDNFDVVEAKKKNPREIELIILKNRNGRTSEKICYSYYTLFNYFKEE